MAKTKLDSINETDLFAAAKASLQEGLKEKSKKLLDEGKRAVIGQDYAGALGPLSECCHLVATNFGEMDDQLAEPAYFYGMAMLEQVRMQQDVFGNGVGGGGDEPKDEAKSTAATTKEENNSDSDDEEEEEEADDQIAHEWLEIARVLYQKRAGNVRDNKLKEASCLGLLADLKSENGQLEDAREDYNGALAIYKEHLDEHDRKIATVLYQRGSVELFLQMPKEAVVSFNESLAAVKSIIKMKKSQIAADSEGKVIGKLLPEVQGLEELVPEIEEKISEAEKMNVDYKRMKETLASAFGLNAPSSSSGFEKPKEEPAKINTLTAKRKNKPSATSKQLESPSKKPKQ